MLVILVKTCFKVKSCIDWLINGDVLLLERDDFFDLIQSLSSDFVWVLSHCGTIQFFSFICPRELSAYHVVQCRKAHMYALRTYFLQWY